MADRRQLPSPFLRQNITPPPKKRKGQSPQQPSLMDPRIYRQQQIAEELLNATAAAAAAGGSASHAMLQALLTGEQPGFGQTALAAAPVEQLPPPVNTGVRLPRALGASLHSSQQLGLGAYPLVPQLAPSASLSVLSASQPASLPTPFSTSLGNRTSLAGPVTPLNLVTSEPSLPILSAGGGLLMRADRSPTPPRLSPQRYSGLQHLPAVRRVPSALESALLQQPISAPIVQPVPALQPAASVPLLQAPGLVPQLMSQAGEQQSISDGLAKRLNASNKEQIKTAPDSLIPVIKEEFEGTAERSQYEPHVHFSQSYSDQLDLAVQMLQQQTSSSHALPHSQNPRVKRSPPLLTNHAQMTEVPASHTHYISSQSSQELEDFTEVTQRQKHQDDFNNQTNDSLSLQMQVSLSQSLQKSVGSTQSASPSQTIESSSKPVSPLLKNKAPIDSNSLEANESKKDLFVLTRQFNQRVQNLKNMGTSSNRATYRSQAMAMHRARAGSITSSTESLDLLRQLLQRHINKDIDALLAGYVQKFFTPAINNIRKNNGPSAISDKHIQNLYHRILDTAKQQYTRDDSACPSPAAPDSDNVSESGSLLETHLSRFKRKRRGSDASSDASFTFGVKKKRGRQTASGRSTPSKQPKVDIKREGPKWDPERLQSDTRFMMGPRANKALGLGNTRGKLYSKHRDLFKYAGDTDDKAWLVDQGQMPPTGAKAYLVLLEDVLHLIDSEPEYSDTRKEELQSFTVPEWFLLKVKAFMMSCRTDNIYADTPSPGMREVSAVPDEDQCSDYSLPFTQHVTSTAPCPGNSALAASPSLSAIQSPYGGDSLSLSPAGAASETTPALSPLSMSRGFTMVAERSSDLETVGYDDHPPDNPFAGR